MNFKGIQRYNLLPCGSQEIFSRVILEPLLNIAVGLFLYRIRSCPTLYPISTGVLPHQSVSDRSVRSSQFSKCSTSNLKNIPIVLDIPAPMIEFKASVQYFQMCLGNISVKSKGISGSTVRFQENWKTARGDFPGDLIKDRSRDEGYSVVDMIRNIMLLSSPSEKEEAREKDQSIQTEVLCPEDFTIGGVVDYARAQVLKMSSVLDTQWSKLQ